MIAVTFALPEESRDFRRAIREVRGDGEGGGQTRVDAEPLRIVHCGVGPASAGECTRKLVEEHRPRLLIATGFAGALDPTLGVGDLVLASNFSEPGLLERARRIAPAVRVGPLASVNEPVETPAAKRALAESTGAIAVEMETAAIAAASAGIPLLAVRAISDHANEPLPVPFAIWFDLACQRPRPARLLAYLARHPGQIAPFARFVRGLRPARQALSRFLLQALQADASGGLTGK
jgi:adenosylhomocysteine nucleosidase